MSPDRLAYMLGSAALSVWVVPEPVDPEVAPAARARVSADGLACVPESAALSVVVEAPVAAGVSADGPQAADIRTIAKEATATSISNRIGKLFRVSSLREFIDPPGIVGFVRFLGAGEIW